MEIRNTTEELKALLGVSSANGQNYPVRHGNNAAAALTEGFGGDQATFSQVGSEVSQAAEQSDVRSEKVAAIQQMLAAGTYSVPAGAVADKVIATMLGGSLGSSH